MMVDIQVYGVHTRDAMIMQLTAKLSIPLDCVHYDDRPNGGLMIYTAKKAWLAPVPDGVTHRVALADDVDVCDNFADICEQIATAHPEDIISFFPYEFRSYNPALENLPTPYLQTSSLFGAAIMMPVKHIAPCFDHIKRVYDDNCADDDGIMSYVRENDLRVLTTIPATVQHIGDKSLITPNAKIRRTVYFDPMAKANWGCQTVMRYQRPEWFFSNRGKIRFNVGELKDVTEY